MSHQRRGDLKVALLVVLALANMVFSLACGGGGGAAGGGTSDSPSPSPSASTTATLTPSPSPSLSPTPDPAAFAVIETEPADQAVDVPVLTVIRVRFSEAANTDAVEAAFTLTGPGGAVTGLPLWQEGDTLLLFTPLTTLAAYSEHTITVAATASNADQTKSLATQFTASFTTSGTQNPDAPTVVSSVPSWSLEASPIDTAVTIEFSKAMNTTSVEAAFALSMLNSEGSIAGAFGWNTENTILTFTPDAALEYAATYSFTVLATAESADGNSLNAPFTVAFQTEGDPTLPPTITLVFPLADSANNPTDLAVLINFSIDMDSVATAAAFSLYQGTAKMTGIPVVTGASLVFRPTANLLPSTQYEIVLTTGAKSATGVNIEAEHRSFFTTGTGTAFHIPVPTLGDLVVSTLDNPPFGSLWQVTSSAATQVDGDDFDVTDSRWAPGGARLAYRRFTATDSNNEPTSWALHLWDGTNTGLVTDAGADAGLYAWSPDGNHLAFTQKVGSNWYLSVRSFPTGSLVIGTLNGKPDQLFWRDNTYIVLRVGSTLLRAARTVQGTNSLATDLNGEFRISPSRAAVAYRTNSGLVVYDLANSVRKATGKTALFDYFDFLGETELAYSTIEGFFPPSWSVKRVNWSTNAVTNIATGLMVLDCAIVAGSGAPDGSAVVYYTVATTMDETYRARIHLISSGTTLPEVVLDAVGGTSPFWDPDGAFVIVSSPQTRSFMVRLTDGATLKTFFFDSTWVDSATSALGTTYLVVGTVLYTRVFNNWQEVGLFGLTNVRTIFSKGYRTNQP